MKLTDLAIVFQLFFMCLVTVLHVKSANLHAKHVNEIMYDKVMDGIVEDSLRVGYKTVDIEGKPVVELNEIKRCFEAETSLYDYEARYVVMYIDVSGFYVWDSDISAEWEEKIPFSNEADTLHEQKIYEVTEYIEEQLGIMLTIPYNEGESFKNTIDDYSLIAMSFNRNYNIESFSGAKIHKK